MEIEPRRFMELAVHVKLASEAILEAARNLAALRPQDSGSQAVAWRSTMDELIAVNVELGFMERLLRHAVHDGPALPRPVRNGRSLPA